MLGYILKRLGYAAISLAILALTVLALTRLGGDPALMLVEPGASQADIDAVRQRLGLDQPFWVQYGRFVLAALGGDLGTSIYYRTPVMELYLQRLPASLALAGVAFAWAVLLGVGTGIVSAVYPNLP